MRFSGSIDPLRLDVKIFWRYSWRCSSGETQNYNADQCLNEPGDYRGGVTGVYRKLSLRNGGLDISRITDDWASIAVDYGYHRETSLSAREAASRAPTSCSVSAHTVSGSRR